MTFSADGLIKPARIPSIAAVDALGDKWLVDKDQFHGLTESEKTHLGVCKNADETDEQERGRRSSC